MVFKFVGNVTKMAKIPIFLMGVLLLCFSEALAKPHYLRYKDPKQPLNVRIRDLLGRMTLEEKIGQMVQIDRTVASKEVMKKYLIGNLILLIFLLPFEIYTIHKKKKET